MLTLILATVLTVLPATSEDVVVFKTEQRISVIAPDRVAAQFVIAKCLSNRQGFYRVEPIDDGTFKISRTHGFTELSSGRSPILGGDWSDNEIRVPADEVKKLGARSMSFAKRTKEGLQVFSDQGNVHYVLFDVMTQARWSYQVGPRVNGIVTQSLTSENIGKIVANFLMQVQAFFLIDGEDLVAINNEGIINRKGGAYRNFDPYKSGR